jgi:hypothetical protein
MMLNRQHMKGRPRMDSSKNKSPAGGESPEVKIEELAKLVEEANKEKSLQTGACILRHPSMPQPKCVQLTAQQCAQVGGMYIGGPCR